jgi:hypothetical protein
VRPLASLGECFFIQLRVRSDAGKGAKSREHVTYPKMYQASLETTVDLGLFSMVTDTVHG